MAKQPQTDIPAHIDNYAGQAGTFINDPLTGTRIPIEDYQPPQPATALKLGKNATTEDKI